MAELVSKLSLTVWPMTPAEDKLKILRQAIRREQEG